MYGGEGSTTTMKRNMQERENRRLLTAFGDVESTVDRGEAVAQVRGRLIQGLSLVDTVRVDRNRARRSRGNASIGKMQMDDV